MRAQYGNWSRLLLLQHYISNAWMFPVSSLFKVHAFAPYVTVAQINDWISLAFTLLLIHRNDRLCHNVDRPPNLSLARPNLVLTSSTHDTSVLNLAPRYLNECTSFSVTFSICTSMVVGSSATFIVFVFYIWFSCRPIWLRCVLWWLDPETLVLSLRWALCHLRFAGWSRESTSNPKPIFVTVQWDSFLPIPVYYSEPQNLPHSSTLPPLVTTKNRIHEMSLSKI